MNQGPLNAKLNVIEVARQAGWKAGAWDGKTGQIITDESGSPVLLASQEAAKAVLENHPTAQGCYVIGSDPGFRVVALECDDGIAFANCFGEELPQTPYLRAGERYWYLFASSSTHNGSTPIGDGVRLLGKGCGVPLPLSWHSKAQVHFDDSPGYLELPETLLPSQAVADESDGNECQHVGEPALNEESAGNADQMAEDAQIVPDAQAPVVLREKVNDFCAFLDSLATAPSKSEATRIFQSQPEAKELAAHLVEAIVERSDAGFAEALERIAQGALLFTQKHTYVLTTDTLWKQDSNGALLIREMVRLISRSLKRAIANLVEGSKQQSALHKALMRYFNGSGAKGVTEALKSYPSLQNDVAKFDQCPEKISVSNGVLDLRTMTLRPRRAKDLLTRAAAFPYTSQSSSPAFEQFLGDALANDEAAIEHLLRFIGYSLTGKPRLKKMLLVVGPSNTGKTILCALLGRIFGPIVEFAHRQVIFRLNSGSTTDPHVVRLIGSRFVIINESTQDETLNDTAIKSMAGGADQLILRGLYRDPIRIDPTWVCALMSNFLPKLPENDTALLERLEFIRFTRSTRARDEGLLDRLMCEGEGVLSSILHAAHRFLVDGLQRPPSLDALRAEILATAKSPISMFFDKNLRLSPSSRVSALNVRERAAQWFEVRGFALPSSKAIGDYVRVAFDEKQVEVLKSAGVMVYKGLELVDDGEESPPNP